MARNQNNPRGRNNNNNNRNKNNNKNNRNNRNNSGKPAAKKKLEDYVFYLGTAKQASDFEIASAFIINHIMKDFERGRDIAEALKNLQYHDTEQWYPTLRTSTAANKDIKKLEDEQYTMRYKGELADTIKRIRIYDDNKCKAYALIWERCNPSMQARIEARNDFDNEIVYEPINLLKAIREHALNYQEHRYEMEIITNAFLTVFNTKEKDRESLQDYTRRFKTSIEVLESHLDGPIILKKYVEKMDDFTVGMTGEPLEKLQQEAGDMLVAFIYLINADRKKYGTLVRGLSTQQSLGNDQYPKTMSQATSVLSNHIYDSANNNNNNNNYNNKRNGRDPDDDDNMPQMTFAMQNCCYCCGAAGHKSPQCRHKDKPKSDWWINNQEQQNFAQPSAANQQNQARPPSILLNQSRAQTNQQENSSTVSTVTQPSQASTNSTTPRTVGWSDLQIENGQRRIGWAGVHLCAKQMCDDKFHHQFLNAINLKNYCILDTGSTVSIMGNKTFCDRVFTSDRELELITNGGIMLSKQRCTVPKFGEVWFNKNSVMNIFGFADVVKRYRIKYDSTIEDAFWVYVGSKIVKFRKIWNGLYAISPGVNDDGAKMHLLMQFLTTVEENKEFYSERQIAGAKKARDLFHTLGCPSVDDMRAAIRMNLINNLPITLADIKVAQEIYGPDIAALKGKSTRRRPIPVIDTTIDIPDELLKIQKEVTLAIDGMVINGLHFLTTVSLHIYYRTLHYTPSKTSEKYREALVQVISLYKRGGFDVTHIRCDNEFQRAFENVAIDFTPPITVNFSNPQEHVPQAERNNHLIKERFRSIYHRLPFQHLPKKMVIY